MKKGADKFLYFLNQFQKLIIAAQQTDNPALYLFKNDGRTPLFMLEGLSRFYQKQHNKKKFKKLTKKFKGLEDALGAIDFYNEMLRDEEPTHPMPETVKTYFTHKLAESTTALNELLLNEYWLSKKDHQFKKIEKKLQKADWNTEKKDIQGLAEFYDNSIEKIIKFYHSTNGSFTHMEDEVHELRRDLRWLSIYPKAMQGAVQLTSSTLNQPGIAAYLTEAVIQSPHNKMPLPQGHHYFLLLEKPNFYALSYMISALGAIKDEGLKIKAYADAISTTEKLAPAEAIQKAQTILGKEPNHGQVLLSKANQICDHYFEHKFLKKLVKGITKKQR